MILKELEALNARIQSVLGDVFNERLRQLEKWGDQKHSAFKWLAIAAEELGEAAKAALEDRTEDYSQELIETAAVCVAAVEDVCVAAVEDLKRDEQEADQ